jgi:hypothetical protein
LEHTGGDAQESQFQQLDKVNKNDGVQTVVELKLQMLSTIARLRLGAG